MKNNQKKFKKSFFAAFALILIFAFGVTIAAADTSVAWTKDIGDVTAADMSEDGSVIYAAVGSQIFVYDAAGVQQNVFTVGGNVVKLVCTADGTRAALYTDGNEVYYIDSGALTWSQSFTAITDIDISNAGSVLVVESGVFHKYLRDGTLEYNSSSGTYNLGVIDPDDEFAIVQSGNTGLQKYLLTTTDQYWGKVGDNSFNTNFSDYQNVLILNVNNTTNPIVLNQNTLGEDIFSEIYDTSHTQTKSLQISNASLIQTNSDKYYDSLFVWTQATSAANWSSRSAPMSWMFDGKMWLAGGYTGSTFYRDVWYSEDGVNWVQATPAANWASRSGAATWTFDGKMWLAGGYTGSVQIRDVWYSEDGVNWVQATSTANWGASTYSATWTFDGKMWLAGGINSHSVWYSEDGVNWVQATSAANWSSRTAPMSWMFDGKMWLAGGANLHDVWYSEDGVNWVQATSAANWSSRAGSATWTFDGKMWLAGGALNIGSGQSAYRDVWYSEDGINWVQTTSAANWAVRVFPAAWTFDGKMWLAGGAQKIASTVMRDVWYSGDYLYIINPSPINPTYVFYNYTRTSPQHTQTTYTGAVPFTGTTELRTKPTLSIYDLQTTKTLNGNIQAISLSDRGDWVGTATSTRIYHDQITASGFGTEYYAALGSTGTIYDIATANSAAMSVVGQGQITDIYSMSASRVGTYTAGGAVQHVDIADKNALWAASGGEDGKVYVFSKDASSNWYLEYSSDSENPITALRMSARGEYILAGRTNSLTLYQTNIPVQTSTDFWFTLYIYRDSDSYRNAAVNVTQYNNGQWTAFSQGVTDSIGKYVVQLTAGQNYKFEIGNNEKVLIYQASPSVTSQTVSIYSSPITTSVEYNAAWDSSTNSVNLNYTDSSGQTQSVNVKILRTDTWETVYDQTFSNQQSFEEVVPIIDDTTSYKVEFTVRRVKGVTRNTFVVSSSRDIIPIPLDPNIKNVLFCGLLFVIAGLFSYLSAIRGAVVVSLTAGLFIYLGWVTIPWEWFVITVVIAMVAGFTQRRS